MKALVFLGALVAVTVAVPTYPKSYSGPQRISYGYGRPYYARPYYTESQVGAQKGRLAAPQPAVAAVVSHTPVVSSISRPEAYTRFHAQDEYGQYQYGYASADGQAKTEIRGIDGSVAGRYSYRDPDGKSVELSYVADKNGFRASGSHLPKGPEIPDALEDAYEEAHERLAQAKARSAAKGDTQDADAGGDHPNANEKSGYAYTGPKPQPIQSARLAAYPVQPQPQRVYSAPLPQPVRIAAVPAVIHTARVVAIPVVQAPVPVPVPQPQPQQTYASSVDTKSDDDDDKKHDDGKYREEEHGDDGGDDGSQDGGDDSKKASSDDHHHHHHHHHGNQHDDGSKDGGDGDSNKDGGDDDSNKDGGDDDSNKDGGDDDESNKDGGDDESHKDGGDDESNKDGGDDESNKGGGDEEQQQVYVQAAAVAPAPAPAPQHTYQTVQVQPVRAVQAVPVRVSPVNAVVHKPAPVQVRPVHVVPVRPVQVVPVSYQKVNVAVQAPQPPAVKQQVLPAVYARPQPLVPPPKSYAGVGGAPLPQQVPVYNTAAVAPQVSAAQAAHAAQLANSHPNANEKSGYSYTG